METLSVEERYELERGKSLPSKHHSFIQTVLASQFLFKYKEYLPMSELSVLIKDKTKVPDIAIYRRNEFDLAKEEIKTQQIPLGVIEILSPKHNITELLEKPKDYFEAGVKSYWLVVPPLKNIFIFHQVGHYTASFEKNDTLKDDVLNVELSLSEIFV